MSKVEAEKKFQSASEEFNEIQQNISKWVSSRQQLEAQLQENKIVKEEFDGLKDDSKIYKLVGPVLLPQEKSEANLNVEKRLEFIQSEIKRTEGNIEGEKKKLEEKRNELIALRAEIQGDAA